RSVMATYGPPTSAKTTTFKIRVRPGCMTGIPTCQARQDDNDSIRVASLLTGDQAIPINKQERIMSKKLAGKVALVTGASKGIGAAIAKHLADEGAAVVVNYSSSREGADRVVAEITKNGGKALAVQADVAKEAEIRRLFAEAREAFGPLDILVNNAGIYEFSPLENVTAEHFHKQFDLNVLGLILASQEAVKHFRSGGGNIINISSGASTAAVPTAAVYSGTK